jgi:hypothetical protein
MNCSRGNSSWYRLRPSRTLAAEAALYRGGFVARFVRSARLEEYQFHRAREKPHSLLFGQTFVQEPSSCSISSVSTPLHVGVLHAWHDVGLKRVPFVDQLIHAL